MHNERIVFPLNYQLSNNAQRPDRILLRFNRDLR